MTYPLDTRTKDKVTTTAAPVILTPSPKGGGGCWYVTSNGSVGFTGWWLASDHSGCLLGDGVWKGPPILLNVTPYSYGRYVLKAVNITTPSLVLFPCDGIHKLWQSCEKKKKKMAPRCDRLLWTGWNQFQKSYTSRNWTRVGLTQKRWPLIKR